MIPKVLQALDRIDAYLSAWKAGKTADRPMLERLLAFWTVAPAFLVRYADQNMGPLVAFPGQVLLHSAMLDQAYQGRPVRIVVGKSRKSHGISTWVQCLGVFLCTHYRNQIAVTIAHEGKATEEIFDIARRAAMHHGYTDPSVLSEIRWPQTNSKYYCQPAGTRAAQAGGTPSFLHHSELAKWETNKESTEAGKIAVPDDPRTIIVQESTFRGRDLFWRRFADARAGSTSYKALFFPWYIDDRLRLPMNGLVPDEYERDLMVLARKDGVTLRPDHLQWRRSKIADVGPIEFRQEFPATPEEAVQAASGLVFPSLIDCVVDRLPFVLSDCPREIRSGGIDFGYVDATSIVTSILYGGQLFVVQVFRAIRSTSEEWIAGMSEQHSYACDPMAVQAMQELSARCVRRCMGCRFHRAACADDDPSSSWLALQKFIYAGRLRILRSAATQLLHEASCLEWDSSKATIKKIRDEKAATGADGQSFGHFDTLDALRYNVMDLLSRERSGGRIGYDDQAEMRISRKAAMRAM